jgi:addiction module HigA family antidote
MKHTVTRKRREYPVTGRAAFAPTHPGAVLRDTVLPALRLSVIETARQLHVSRQTLHRILSEQAAVTPEMAVRLGRFCGNGPRLWLRLQQEYDLRRAEETLAKEIRNIPVHGEAINLVGA